MIKSVSLLNPVTNENIVTFELKKPGATGFAITRIEGLGPPAASINATDYAMMDGAAFNSARVGTRNIVLYFTFLDNDLSIEELRYKAYEYFPVKSKVQLHIVTDHREGYIIGYVESNEPDIFSNMETVQVSIICPEPLFHGTLDYQKILFSEVEALFHFPFSNPSLDTKLLTMGRISKTTEKELMYTGDSGEGVIIFMQFSGVVKDITVSNSTTGQRMFIDTEKVKKTSPGFKEFAENDGIIITTMFGNKTITLQYVRPPDENKKSKNILNCLSDDSEWITLQHGKNILRVTAAEGQENIAWVGVLMLPTFMGL